MLGSGSSDPETIQEFGIPFLGTARPCSPGLSDGDLKPKALSSKALSPETLGPKTLEA